MSRIIEVPEISEYKGKPVLSIPIGGGFAFSFGSKKAEAILEHLDAIKSFVESNGKSVEEK